MDRVPSLSYLSKEKSSVQKLVHDVQYVFKSTTRTPSPWYLECKVTSLRPLVTFNHCVRNFFCCSPLQSQISRPADDSNVTSPFHINSYTVLSNLVWFLLLHRCTSSPFLDGSVVLFIFFYRIVG